MEDIDNQIETLEDRILELENDIDGLEAELAESKELQEKYYDFLDSLYFDVGKIIK